MNQTPSTPQRVIRKRAGEHQRYASGFLYQKAQRYFAQIAAQLVEEGVNELRDLGATRIEATHSGVHFNADKKVLYGINYMSRLISRVLAPIDAFPCMDSDQLYKKAKQIRWENLLTLRKTFSIFTNVSDSRIAHSQFAGLRLKDAISDYFRERTGKRPSVNTLHPDIMINLHIRNDHAHISIDTSGGALHRRGYREETISAPMQETLAAALIKMSGWDGTVPLYDPMCGSGTLLCEALMAHCHIPAAVLRDKFGFQGLPDYNPELWEEVKSTADRNIKTSLTPGRICGSDISEVAVNATKTNLMGLHNGGSVTVNQMDFKEIPDIRNSVVVLNPPYGIRIGRDQNLKRLHSELGDFLKNRCKGSEAYIYFGDPHFMKQIGLKAAWKKAIKAGGLDGRLAKYELY